MPNHADWPDFDLWWDAVIKTAADEDLACNEEDPEAYRPYWEAGHSPLDALTEDASYG